ncbi:spindle pole body interacting protein [Ramicandelaber brevisporus]|nr:spindle pole body interacting protein [Ramicandelaber brevisporus]
MTTDSVVDSTAGVVGVAGVDGAVPTAQPSSSSPADDRHVEYILLAEFDIDKGSSLTHQYPQPTGTDEQLLAELMLPDGAHLRDSDWTVFFINQPNSTNGSLLHVLNLVRTKHDKGVRRGAMVKALAICTRHQYLHMYKPILTLALEKYFANPVVDTLANLYEAVNAMDLSGMPHLSSTERIILRRAENSDMFVEKFELNTAQAQSQVNPASSGAGTGAGAATGTGTGAGASGPDPSKFIDLTTGTIKNIAPTQKKNKDRRFFETEIIYEGIRLPVRVPLTVHPGEIGDFSLTKLVMTFGMNTNNSGNGASQGITNSGGSYGHAHLDSGGGSSNQIILLINALLTQKRVLFLGHGRPAGEVADFVLAACALGSGCGGVLRGFANRAFPYTNLTNLDALLSMPGYIAGVTNPMFEDHPQWWDVLCNIITGKITVSTAISPAPPPSLGVGDYAPSHALRRSFELSLSGRSWGRSGQSGSGASGSGGISAGGGSSGNSPGTSLDIDFMNDIVASINKHYSESAIRSKFEAYIRRFAQTVALYEYEMTGESSVGFTPATATFPGTPTSSIGYGPVFLDEEAKIRELSQSRGRIEGFLRTPPYHWLREDFTRSLDTRTIKGFDVEHQIARLREGRGVSEREVEAIFSLLATGIQSDEQVLELLSYLPQDNGGLFPIAFGLFHPSRTAKDCAVQLLLRIVQHPAGARYLQSMNLFHRMTFENLAKRLYPNSLRS